MDLHYPRDTEYRSLLLHENDFDLPDEHKFTPCIQWSSKLTERRGIQLSHGVAQMLQLWPALLSNILRTFILVLTACFVFVLAILTLVFTTNFSFIAPSYPPLHVQTRSLHSLPPNVDVSTHCRHHTESVYRYIITGSEDTVNLFYVIGQDDILGDFARKLLKYYVRAGYRVVLVRVCRTRFVDGKEVKPELFGVGKTSKTDGDFGKNRDDGRKNFDFEGKNNETDEKNELDSLFNNSDKRSVGSEDKVDGRTCENNTNVKSKNVVSDSSQKISKIDVDRVIQNEIGGADGHVLTRKGLVLDSHQSTADIETYDAKMQKEIASDFGQSREFFNRLRKILSKNRTFAANKKTVELSNDKPITSLEINEQQTNDELKKIQLCTCPGCGHVITRGRAIFGPDARDQDLARVELLNVNYREFLCGSMFERHLIELDSNTEKSNATKPYDLNIVKLLLLWKFGNSVVLLGDQTTLLHSSLIDRGRVNLGFHVIYTPYECASVIYNLMREYEREQSMRKAIGRVYRMFCKKTLRGFCNAIRYVQFKRK